MEPRHAKLIAEHCKRPELEAMLLDEKLSYWAMHEAEKVLTKIARLRYYSRLFSIAQNSDDYDQFALIHATAAQRAEQFLRTLNLWVEEPVSEATIEGLR